MSAPLSIGNRIELFVDRYLVEALRDARMHLHEPVRREVVFQVEAPMENACTGCYNVTQEGNRVLVYYRGFYPIGPRFEGWEATQTANLIVSEDGVWFERPHLGLVETNRSKDNHVIYQGYEGHNFTVFLDRNPASPPERRFKAVGGSSHNNLHGFVSPDGLHWSRIQDGPLDIVGAFDSVNVPLWDAHAKKYRLFSRYFEPSQGGHGIRAIQSCMSDDFIHWTPPVAHVYDPGVPMEHFYTNATMTCPGAEHILLSFPMRFLPDRTKINDGAEYDYQGEGVSDAVFMSSRDGIHWDRTFLEAWLRPGPDRCNWTHRNQVPAAGIVTTAPDEWSMYVTEHYGWSTNRLRRVTVRPYGFASINAGYRGGEVITRPISFSGQMLYLNYATSAAGSIKVEIQDAHANPIPGFSIDDCVPIFGDATDEAVLWRNGGDIAALAGSPVRLRFVLQDADLFAMRTG
ncbi:MAG: hypothetical protein FJY97_02890 [candidate division Zixibacteria bacterium]|nr:hypothetical protein [candidate division Zixibacteria bacterium]